MNGSSQNGGFTLVETVVAMLLLALGLAGAWMLSAQLFRVTTYTGDLTDATMLASDKLEEMLGLDPGSLASGSDTVAAYQRSWTVSAGTGPDSRIVDINVQWSDSDGHSHQSALKGLAGP